VRFTGRGAPKTPRESRREVLDRISPASLELAWLRQIHSNRVLEAQPGLTAEGDALWTDQRGLALCIATADCVPIVIAAADRVATVHAGWRGIIAGIVSAAVDVFPEPARLTAWIGPAIGACCYEVGEDVATRIAESASPKVINANTGHRPHADLSKAVEIQLSRLGVEDIRRLGECTACDCDRLWSYRREGPGAGRNLTFAWISE